jgi:hypothetical protein
MVRYCTFLLSLFIFAVVQAQTISGIILDEKNEPLPGALVKIKSTNIGAISDQNGSFTLSADQNLPITISVNFLGYERKDTIIYDSKKLIIIQLKNSEIVLDELNIKGEKVQEASANLQLIDSKSAANLASVFSDFSKVIASLPGVTSNNELSSGYSVRGGNFDENLVYVNDIPIYRPFLSNAGQQEGLSFVNPELVSKIKFYSGGWPAKYGDKLSSNLLIEYKEPERSEASITLGLLGGSAYSGWSSKNKRINYLTGVRHRDSRYLLNTLEVGGQYFPKYTDVQSFITFDLTRKELAQTGKTKLNWLFAYSRNRYLTLPVSQTTEFGSVQATFRLETAFQGRELLNYDTYQTGFKLNHQHSQKYSTALIGSWVSTREIENYEVEGAYRLCDVDNNPASGTFDNCVITRGVGTDFKYGRNQLNANIASIENRHETVWSLQTSTSMGVGITVQAIDDQINEYRFIDSADFISVTNQVFNELNLSNQQYFAYAQQTMQSKDSLHMAIIGGRLHYYTLNNQVLFSPRFLYQFKPSGTPSTYTLSLGRYQQPPFYRELRDVSGNINKGVQAQTAIHAVLGMNRNFIWSGRPFNLSTSLYYKHLSNLTPFEVDNVRLRYFASNVASGNATGLDIRVNGEFIPGTQSWFSFGLMKTKENIPNDDRGYIRRPLDQVVTISAYFEDHMPNDPSLRVYFTLNLGSGYPFGPPGNPQLRNVFSGDEYYRADIGLSKYFLSRHELINKYWVRLEVLNVLAADNTLAYSWINDTNGTGFAIPNSLTARLFNLKLSVDF